MENTELLQALKSKFEQNILSVDENADVFTLVIAAESIKEIIAYLKNEQNYIFLTDICGVHFPEQEKELGVVYHLHNLVENKRKRLGKDVAPTRIKYKKLIR